jgi:hypothetical protein
MLGLKPKAEFSDNWDLRVFLLANHSHLTSTNGFYSPPLEQKWFKTGLYTVNIVYGNFKSENSQGYAQKRQRNCTFMNSASGPA